MESEPKRILVELATQGNPAAIATLLNQTFQPHEMSVKVSVNHNVLKIVLVSEGITDQTTLISLLTQELYQFKEIPFEKFKLHCHRKNKRLAQTQYNIWTYEQKIPKDNNQEKIVQNFSENSQTRENKQEKTENIEAKKKRKISPSEFQEALQRSRVVARQAYNTNIAYADKVETLIKSLKNNIQAKNVSSSNSQSNNDEKVFKELVDALGKILDNDLQALRSSLDQKKKHLEGYTVPLFGRTKAGKSTIREALTQGDGSTIGKGAQRTTRETYEYSWQGLRLIDTPGIEAYRGEEDTEKANEIIDQADMILFLTSDDSVQQGEFEQMAKLKQINKYFVVLLNIKENLDRPQRLQRFLQKPETVFDEKRLSQHHRHIVNYIQEYLAIEHIDIINVQARAAFLSTQPEYAEVAEKLWELSRLEEVYSLIAEDIYYHGNLRRISTFFDGTSDKIRGIEENLSKCSNNLEKPSSFIASKQTDIQKLFQEFLDDSRIKLNNKVSSLFSQFKQKVPYFVDNNIGTDKAEGEWKNLNNTYNDKIKDSIKEFWQEVLSDLKEKLKEVEREYSYDAESIQLNFDIDNLNQGEAGKFIKNLSLILGGIAAAAFVAANWWNPAGWVVVAGWVSTGLGFIASIISGKVKDEEKKEFDKKRQNLKNELINKINEQQIKTINACTRQLEEQVKKIKQSILEPMSSYHKRLSSIREKVKEAEITLNCLNEQLKLDCNSQKNNS
jgi:predicted GTPase